MTYQCVLAVIYHTVYNRLVESAEITPFLVENLLTMITQFLPWCCVKKGLALEFKSKSMPSTYGNTCI